MNTGDKVWWIPTADMFAPTPECRTRPDAALFKDVKLPPQGSSGQPQVITTKTLVIFGTGRNGGPPASNRKLVRRGQSHGQAVGELPIPAKTSAVPMTFMHNGRQYIVFATGAGQNTALSRADAAHQVGTRRAREGSGGGTGHGATDADPAIGPRRNLGIPGFFFVHIASMVNDLRFALRSLRATPTVTLVALLVLTLGIGATTAIFSVVDAVVLRGLPFDEHDRLVAVGERRAPRPDAAPPAGPVRSRGGLQRRAAELHGLGGAAAGLRVDRGDRRRRFTLREPGAEPEELRGAARHGEFFEVLRESARARASAFTRGERSRRPAPGRRAQRWALAPPLRRRSGHRRQDDSDRRRRVYEVVGVMAPDFSIRSAPPGRPNSGCRTSFRPTNASATRTT